MNKKFRLETLFKKLVNKQALSIQYCSLKSRKNL